MCITLRRNGKLFRIPKDKKGRRYGWKVFREVNGGGYVGQFCGTRTVRTRDKWLKAKDYSPILEEMESAMSIYGYVPGWHLFRRRSEAIRYSTAIRDRRIVKVLVRKTRERGYIAISSNPLNCFIADEIFIPT